MFWPHFDKQTILTLGSCIICFAPTNWFECLDVMIRFGGSYNLRDSEGKNQNTRKTTTTQADNCANANDAQSGQFINCSVFFLDDTENNFQVTVCFLTIN